MLGVISNIEMASSVLVKDNKISIPQEIVDKLGIGGGDILAFDVTDGDTIKVKVLRKGDYTSDPVWKAIHSPAKSKKKVTAEDLRKMEDELWLS